MRTRRLEAAGVSLPWPQPRALGAPWRDARPRAEVAARASALQAWTAAGRTRVARLAVLLIFSGPRVTSSVPARWACLASLAPAGSELSANQGRSRLPSCHRRLAHQVHQGLGKPRRLGPPPEVPGRRQPAAMRSRQQRRTAALHRSRQVPAAQGTGPRRAMAETYHPGARREQAQERRAAGSPEAATLPWRPMPRMCCRATREETPVPAPIPGRRQEEPAPPGPAWGQTLAAPQQAKPPWALALAQALRQGVAGRLMARPSPLWVQDPHPAPAPSKVRQNAMVPRAKERLRLPPRRGRYLSRRQRALAGSHRTQCESRPLPRRRS
jgi:hypothetical protein